MRHNISAFDVIPQSFRDWLKAVLQGGKRLAPPGPLGGPVIVLSQTAIPFLVASGKLSVSEFLDLEGWCLQQYTESGGKALLLLSDGKETRVSVGNRVVFSSSTLPGTTLVGFTPRMCHPVLLNLHQGQLIFVDLERKQREVLPFRADELAFYDNRFYIRNGTQVLEVEFSELPTKIIATASHMVADVLERASHLYDGVVIQNMCGSVCVSVFPASKTGYQVKVPELDNYKVIDANFDGGVLMVVGAAANGKYDRLVFRFDPDY